MANHTVLVCGNFFDGAGDSLRGPTEILIEDDTIAAVNESVGRSANAQVIDLSDRTVTPGFIDTHVHLFLDGMNLRLQILESSASKALSGLHLARQYMRFGFTTMRDMGTFDEAWPGIDLRNAIDAGILPGPRLIIAPHMISASGGHGDMQGAFPCRCHRGLSKTADSPGKIRELVRSEHARGADWIKTMNTGGYMSFGDDPARVTWFDEEMQIVAETAHQLGVPVAVHTGAAEGCRQALRAGARSLEHCYLIDDEGIAMAEKSGAFLVPTMEMTREDKAMLRAGTLPKQAVWKFERDLDEIERAQRRMTASSAKIAFGTDCGMFPFSRGIFEFQAMVEAGLSTARALKAATSVAAELLQQTDIGVLEVGRKADIVAMEGDPIADIAVTTKVDFVMRGGRVYRHGAYDLLI
ncbi:Imidazolonepropionase [Burkholderia sp. WP9]|uniref:amidohydrolase family protein n=1 Tax=Burkholderia sp. WP9 TaxID=1500263 RepID=UPI00089B71A3|nr:amidohydrolase family protein [Burkholderia sp. WP9]SEF13122.1 Imidazolonepropionase [Burkholderia sp. WP9]